VDFIALWWLNGICQTSQSCQFFNQFCSDPHLYSWILDNDQKNFKRKRQMWDFCEEFTVWHFATKCTAVKFVKPGIFSYGIRRTIWDCCWPWGISGPRAAALALPWNYGVQFVLLIELKYVCDRYQHKFGASQRWNLFMCLMLMSWAIT